MPVEHRLGSIEQIPRGEGRNFGLAGDVIAVFRSHNDEVFATQPRCPHRNGPLADGLLGEATLVCPLHDLAYDLRTGAGVGHELCLKTYPAGVNAEGVISVYL